MEWYKIEFEPFDYPFGEHYLGYINGKFKIVRRGAANLFSQEALLNDEKLISFLENKTYRLIKPQRIYNIIKYKQ